MIQVICKSCNKSIRAPLKYAGKVAKCPGCKTPFRVPSPIQQVEEELELAEIVEEDDDPYATQDPYAAEDPFAAPLDDDPFRDPLEGANTHQQFSAPLQRPVGTPRNQFTSPPKDVAKGSKKAKSKSSEMGPAVGALFAAAGVAFLCTVGWVMLWALTGLQVGLLAWGTGGLIGLVAGAIAKNPSPVFCSLAAVIAAISIFSSKIIMALIIMVVAKGIGMVQNFANFNFEDYRYAYAIKDQMLADDELAGTEKALAQKQVDDFFGNNDSFYDSEDDELDIEVSDALDEKVSLRLKEMSVEEKDAAMSESAGRHPGWFQEEHNYAATLIAMFNDGEITDEGLAEHASIDIRALSGDYDEDYYQNNTPASITKRRKELRAIVAAKFETIDLAQRDVQLREAITEHPNWVPLHEDYLAVLEKMHTDGKFSGELAKHAEAQIDEQLEFESTDYYETLEEGEYDRHDKSIQKLVNEELVKLDADQRATLVTDLKERYPEWGGGGLLAYDTDELEESLAQLNSDGTFSGSYKSVSSWFDVIWLLLGTSTAFTVAQKWGNKA